MASRLLDAMGMTLSTRDLEKVKGAARQGTQEALENVGLFARTPEEITARRGEFAYLSEQYQSNQWLRKQIKRKGLLIVAGTILIVLMMLIKQVSTETLARFLGWIFT